ncbi:iron permease FTR1 [Guyanagaster necrorhizus]|uniref:Iron permease FTR1 n=1 Tax=Guyanagaster necrorhizus TaxID=856835 RepID=A0A9P7VJB8_9AGAR|nr:iron permease FTR1 [Guyanagaster necrorhizus MCA 3950]KAG7441405.1 iron permease FTR1 [Guyanagaster necrorhizus MCA 3950]
MTKNLFSVPIFFIVFRETLEAAIIISVLLGIAEQIVHDDQRPIVQEEANSEENTSGNDSDSAVKRRRLIRKLRVQIFLGAAIGLFIAVAIGAAFIAVWFTKASNLWSKAEKLWEGIFELIASLMIFVMGLTMLKMDRAKAKWRIKLQKAFDGSREQGSGTTGKWVLFILPLITVLREGMEAVIFVGGVSLGQPATSIPIAAIVGLVCGFICGFLIYQFASRTTLTTFLIVMTNFVLLIGAGLFSRAVGSFEENAYNHLLGKDVDDAGGSGPGSYRVQGNVWHLDCCNPNDYTNGQGWMVFNAILGWSNNGSLGTILSYVFYWIAVIASLVYMKWKEGRVKVLGIESAAGLRRRIRREKKQEESISNEQKDEAVVEEYALPKE